MKKHYLIILICLLSINNLVFAQFTSNLPIIIITTPGVIGTTQIQGNMSIIDNVSGVNVSTGTPTFIGMIGIKHRGNLAYAKKSYSIETWSAPLISIDTSLLGMPSENDWVLLGNYPDRSLMRNVISNVLHEKMGRYAPRMKHCELIVNNQYLGVYNFGETIKRNINRLDISKLTVNDNNGYNMTGGYIWKLDDGIGAGWQSAFAPPYGVTQTINFLFDYPDNADITPSQIAYIKSYVDSFENELNAANFQDTLNGWRKHGAVNAFIDFIIMQELSRNNEAYRQNNYFFKDKGTKMRPGPLWGGDLAWKNTASCNSSKDTGWCYNFGGACGAEPRLPTFWWKNLTSDTLFMKDLKCRYIHFRMSGDVLDTVEIFKIVDSLKTKLNANGALTRNFIQWPIWAVPIVNEPTPMALDYNTEIANLKQFIKLRLSWLDGKWTTPPNCDAAVNTTDIIPENLVSIYPVPTANKLYIEIKEMNTEKYSITLIDLQGKLLFNIDKASQKNIIDISDFSKGIYFLQIKSDKEHFVKKVVFE